MQFIQEHAALSGKRIVDVGCGGGILTEALVQAGAEALGIDLSEELIEIADLHGLESGITAHYQVISAEALAAQQPASFDHVTCMEMLEHVPDPAGIINACATLVKPGGMVFFFYLKSRTQSLFTGYFGRRTCFKNASTRYT
jgi:2-polyprenyl-6-hydroxyphenyl methylase/3-demethylubiquinone-9 3-methyltransferase